MKCKKKTQDVNPKVSTSNGRSSRKSTCAECGTKKTVFVSSQKGGNPVLAALPALAEAGKSVQGTFQAGINAIDNQLDRGFEKNKMTGKYDRINDKNERATMKRNYAFAKRMAKRYGGTLESYLPS